MLIPMTPSPLILQNCSSILLIHSLVTGLGSGGLRSGHKKTKERGLTPFQLVQYIPISYIYENRKDCNTRL